MNTSIDIIAAFNPEGDIKPVYIRLENENHKLQTYKLEINCSKPEKYSGLNSLFYVCSIQNNNQLKEIKLRYYCESHKWVLVQ